MTPNANTRFGGGWPNSYAFGGWIYNASVNLNYSAEPTEIRLSIVLETSSFNQGNASFDIGPEDLNCSAGGGGDEKLYEINIDGVIFKDFILYEYDFSIDANDKILNVVFKDYSIILDKIYIGLFKSQGYKQEYIKVMPCTVEMPIRCLDCQYDGTAITGVASTTRDISFASYAKINGNFVDNLLSVNNYFSNKKNVFDFWNGLIEETKNGGGNRIGGFDLNGGYLILGTESVTSERCNSSPNITYSFIELLASLKKNGMQFGGAFPSSSETSDTVYRNSYIGTLREVLQNWCSDLGFDFYCKGKEFVGIDLKKAIDISSIYTIGDPTTELGRNFNVGSQSAILSLKSYCSLKNTFRQSVIVQNSYPITQVERQKNIKRYIGITPLHSISLNEINRLTTSDTDLYGNLFSRSKYEVSYFDQMLSTDTYQKTFSRLDNRSFADVDAAIALSNYNDTLRDLFVANRALRNYFRGDINFDGYVKGKVFLDGTFNYLKPALTNPYCYANFNALGIFPILEVFDDQLKADIIDEFFQNGEKNGIANLNTDSRYFKIFIGYYSEKLKGDIVKWEKAAAQSMYKYGVATKGPLTAEPFIPPDVLNDISASEGFYGKKGLNYIRIKNTFTPFANRYKSTKEAPYADTLLYSGLVRNSSSKGLYPENNPDFPSLVPPGFSEYPGRLPTGLWVFTLDNPWGTTQEAFNKSLSFNFEDECYSKTAGGQTVDQVLTDSDNNPQDWKLEYFLPVISPDLSRIADLIETDLYDVGEYIDGVISTYVDLNLIGQKDCKKLHVIIIPDTYNHPNLQLAFQFNNINKINSEYLNLYKQKVYEAEQNKKLTQTPSICSLSLIDEMCQSILSGGLKASTFKNLGDKAVDFKKQIGCVILEDKNNYLLDGFDKNLIYQPNSRSLYITIEKNPGTAGEASPATDINGDYYLADLAEGFLETTSRTATIEIVYPIQSVNSIANYSGILSTDISIESRLPALNQIYGEPVSTTDNNVSSIKIINKQTDDSLNPELNPATNEAMSFITVLGEGGNANVIKTPAEYYNLIKNLNEYNVTTPMKSIDMVLAGSPRFFGEFSNKLSPEFGLNQLSLSVTDNGVKTSLSFSDRPKVLPQQESILNKIGPRIKGNYN